MNRVAHVLTCALLACSTPAREPAVMPSGATPVATAIALGMTPISVDERGLPRLLRASSQYSENDSSLGKPRDAALAHIAKLSRAWGVDENALPVLEPIGDVPVRAGTIVRVQQSIDGLPIDRGELRALVRDTGELVAINGTLVGTATPRGAPRFELDDATAISRALADAFGSFDASKLVAHATRRGFTGRSGSIDVPLAAIRRAWVHDQGALVAAWIVEAYAGRADSTAGDAFRAVVAGDGRVLARHSLVADATFSYRVFAESTGELQPLDGPLADVSPHPTAVPDGSYPAFVTPNLVTVDGLNHPPNNAPADPWLIAGRTETLGNNVEAYADLNAPSGLTFGDFRATTTAAGVFDRTYDTAAGPLSTQNQQMAAVTSLFFVINWLHDFWYDAGFVEAAGNGQDSNFGRGGVDRDAILAEAQDNALGGSRNNANMSTPSDGLPPRMQVFLWTGFDERTLSVSGRSPLVGIANYGVDVFDVTAEVVLADDGTGPNPHDLCESIINDVTNKIVLVDRGDCTFESKALKIQNAGGLGMLLANNNDNTTPPTMGNDADLEDPITIAQLSILRTEGDTLKAELLAAPVTASMHRLVGPELDGAIDSTLIAHEFGHYLHHRLQQCNTRMCSALSEGWGDFLSLMIMSRPGDDLTGAYPFAVYVTPSFTTDPAYFGIRRVPYSVNTALNALSFRHMANGVALPTDEQHPMLKFGINNEVHNAGEIWATAMWEAYVALQQQGGSFDETRARMASYVVTGLLIAPTDGTPTETRDAILLAALASSQADHDTLAAAFARRGLGSCAVSPDRFSTSFTGITESSELHANIIGAAPVVTAFRNCDADDVIDGGETGRVVVAVSNRGAKPLVGATVTLTSTTPGIDVTSAPITLDLAPYATTTFAIDIGLDAGVNTPLDGTFDVTITGDDSCQMPVVLSATARLNVDDVPRASATDSFDTAESIWNPTFFAIWQHQRERPLDGHWHGFGLPQVSDASIESPALVAGSDPVTVTFAHRFQFEADGTTNFDGGVIEFSLDNGETWIDMLSLVPTIGYGATPIGGAANPLGGRRGFTGTSAGYPAPETVTLDFGTQLANKTFRIRFRIGTDNTGASTGWDIDDVAFTGIVGTPFPAQVPDTSACGAPPNDGGEPGPSPDGGCCGAAPLPAGNALIALGAFAWLRRRRRVQ